MKALIAALLGVLVAGAAQAQTRLDVIPLHPADCTVRDYPRLNWVYDVVRTGETEKTASFEFKTQHGSCTLSVLQSVEIERGMLYVGLAEDRMAWPWQKERVKYTSELLADGKTVKVSLAFNKAKIFKKKDLAQFYMVFEPYGAFGFQYQWRLDLRKEGAGRTSLHVTTM